MITATSKSLKEQDCHLARQGFRVHPIRPKTKKPYLKNYKRLATTDEKQIQGWWEKWPDASPGLIVNKNILVLDVDRHPFAADGLDTLDKLQKEHSTLPATWSVSRPTETAGLHLYFRLPAHITLRGCHHLAPGVDILGQDANLVGPGALHEDGAHYRWNEFCNPETMAMAEAPPWLIDSALQVQAPQKTQPLFFLSKTQQASIPGGDSNTCLLGSEKRTGSEIRQLFADETVIRQCLPFCGILGKIAIGQSFSCPFHEPDTHPSAAIVPPTGDHPTFLFVCHHSDKKGVSLPELYYQQVTGHRAGHLPRASFLVWATRLLVAAGVLTPQPINAPKLWPSAPPEAQPVYEGFLDLLRIRSLLTERYAPFSWTFALQWLGHRLSEHAMSKGMRWLLAKGYLMKAGRESGLQLFRLGGQILRKNSKTRWFWRHKPQPWTPPNLRERPTATCQPPAAAPAPALNILTIVPVQSARF